MKMKHRSEIEAELKDARNKYYDTNNHGFHSLDNKRMIIGGYVKALEWVLGIRN